MLPAAPSVNVPALKKPANYLGLKAELQEEDNKRKIHKL